jgi:hypothetical protein
MISALGPLSSIVRIVRRRENMHEEDNITDTIVIQAGGEVRSQDAGRRRTRTTPAKAGEMDAEMSEASVLAGAPGGITRGTGRTTVTEGVARTRGQLRKTGTVSQPVVSFTAGGSGETTRKRRSIEALNESRAKPDMAEQIAQLKELILVLMQRQQEHQEKQEEKQEKQEEKQEKQEEKQKASYERQEERLEDFIKKQTDRTEELIQRQKELQRENEDLQKENRELRATITGNSVRRPTFAEIARRGSGGSTTTGADTSVRTSSDENHTRIRMEDDPRTITINTFRVEGEKHDFNIVKGMLQRTISSYKVLEGVWIECLRPLPGDRINVVFRTEEEARKAREHKQWVTTAMPTARVKGEPWYPIKCDMVAKEAVCRTGEGDKVMLKTEVCEKFKDDNSEGGLDCTAYQARWLSKPNPQKRTGSLVIWLKNKLSAEHLLRKGQVLFGAYGAFCSQYYSAPSDGPCYNCNSYGHKQSHCKKPAKCGICSEKHQTRDCTNRDRPKCPACTGPHPIFDRRCIRHPRHIEKEARKGDESSEARTNPRPNPWTVTNSDAASLNRTNPSGSGPSAANEDQTQGHPPAVTVRSPIHQSRSLGSADVDMGSLNPTQC